MEGFLLLNLMYTHLGGLVCKMHRELWCHRHSLYISLSGGTTVTVDHISSVTCFPSRKVPEPLKADTLLECCYRKFETCFYPSQIRNQGICVIKLADLAFKFKL